MTSTEPLLYNPLAPGHIANPYPHFAEMRQHEPVHLTLVSQWVLLRYDDTFRPPRDPALASGRSVAEHQEPDTT